MREMLSMVGCTLTDLCFLAAFAGLMGFLAVLGSL